MEASAARPSMVRWSGSSRPSRIGVIGRQSFNANAPNTCAMASQRCAAIARYVTLPTRDQRSRATCFTYRSTTQIATGTPSAMQPTPARRFTPMDLVSIEKPAIRQATKTKKQAMKTYLPLGVWVNKERSIGAQLTLRTERRDSVYIAQDFIHAWLAGRLCDATPLPNPNWCSAN